MLNAFGAMRWGLEVMKRGVPLRVSRLANNFDQISLDNPDPAHISEREAIFALKILERSLKVELVI